MNLAETPCWADRLSSAERAEWARMLARASKRAFDATAHKPLARAAGGYEDGTHRYGDLGSALLRIVAEMSDLHLDVTERAATPPEVAAVRERGWQQKQEAGHVR